MTGEKQLAPASKIEYSEELQVLRARYANLSNKFGKATEGFVTSPSGQKIAVELIFAHAALFERAKIENRNLKLTSYQTDQLASAEALITSSKIGQSGLAVELLKLRGRAYGRGETSATYTYESLKEDLKSPAKAEALVHMEKINDRVKTGEMTREAAKEEIIAALRGAITWTGPKGQRLDSRSLSAEDKRLIARGLFVAVGYDGTLNGYNKSYQQADEFLQRTLGASSAGLENPHAEGKALSATLRKYVPFLNAKQPSSVEIKQPSSVEILEDPRLFLLGARLAGVKKVTALEDEKKLGELVAVLVPYDFALGKGISTYSGEYITGKGVVMEASGVCYDQAALLANLLASYGIKCNLVGLVKMSEAKTTAGDILTFYNSIVDIGKPFVSGMEHVLVLAELGKEVHYLDATNKLYGDEGEILKYCEKLRAAEIRNAGGTIMSSVFYFEAFGKKPDSTRDLYGEFRGWAEEGLTKNIEQLRQSNQATEAPERGYDLEKNLTLFWTRRGNSWSIMTK